MLGKLLKYEFRSTARTLLPLYGAFLAVALLFGLVLDRLIENDIGALVFSLAYFGLFVAMIVLTILVIIQRFNRNLLKDEGYLMFTLPVDTHSLICSKLIASLVWCVAGTLVVILSVFLLMILWITPELFGHLQELWSDLLLFLRSGYVFECFLTIVSGLLSYMTFLLTVYTALSIGQIPTFNQHRGVSAFVFFFVINIAISMVNHVVLLLFNPMLRVNSEDALSRFSEQFLGISGVSGFSSMMELSIISSIICNIILYFVTYRILSRSLNLE